MLLIWGAWVGKGVLSCQGQGLERRRESNRKYTKILVRKVFPSRDHLKYYFVGLLMGPLVKNMFLVKLKIYIFNLFVIKVRVIHHAC